MMEIPHKLIILDNLKVMRVHSRWGSYIESFLGLVKISVRKQIVS